MSQQLPEPLTEIDLALLNQLITVACEQHDGHLTMMRFSTNWRIGFGTLHDRRDISRMPKGATFAETAHAALIDPRSLHDYQNDTEARFAKPSA